MNALFYMTLTTP